MAKINMPEDNSLDKLLQDAFDRIEKLERALSDPKEAHPPAGGTTGQVLKKASNADYDYVWGSDNT